MSIFSGPDFMSPRQWMVPYLCLILAGRDRVMYQAHTPTVYKCACGKDHSVCRMCGQPLEPGVTRSLAPSRPRLFWIGFTPEAVKFQALWATPLVQGRPFN